MISLETQSCLSYPNLRNLRRVLTAVCNKWYSKIAKHIAIHFKRIAYVNDFSRNINKSYTQISRHILWLKIADLWPVFSLGNRRVINNY